MDKTLRPAARGEKPSGKVPAKKKLVIKKPAPKENRDTRVAVDLPPALYMVTGSSSKEFPLDTDDYMFTIGRDENATVTIADNELSPEHLVIMKVKDECIFMDKGKRDMLAFDGIKTRQAFRPMESRLVIQLGKHWLVYEASNIVSTDTVSIDQNLIADELSQKATPGKATFTYKGKEWSTTKNSCLIGTHPICDIRILSDSAAAFTAMVSWNAKGVFIEKMGACRAAVCVNGARINNPVKLKGDEVISIGREEIQVAFEGDVNARAHSLFRKVAERPELALTVLAGAESKTYPLAPNSMFGLGRVSTADIHIDSPSVSRSHCKIMVRDKLFSLQDNESFNKTIVNREEVSKTTVFPGDLIELGDVALLAHYNVFRF
ncbi:MAG: FHA domain-containing protein [Lentisphaeraceae bacterium]|nr:FHA domain-containing protein [Lentisphaeraceae bacterium]